MNKKLDIMAKLLPYLNERYNILCSNPDEHVKEDIKPLSWSEIHDILGEEAERTLIRTKNALMKLTIGDSYLLGQVSTNSGYYIVVNPYVCYKGRDLEDVKYLYSMVSMPVVKIDNKKLKI